MKKVIYFLLALLVLGSLVDYFFILSSANKRNKEFDKGSSQKDSDAIEKLVSFDSVINRALFCIVNGFDDSLKIFDIEHPVEYRIAISHIIKVMKEGNPENEANYFVAKKMIASCSNSLEYHSALLKEKEYLISDPDSINVDAILKLVNVTLLGDKMPLRDFNEIMNLIFFYPTPQIFGLEYLVENNPQSTKWFVNDLISEIEAIDTASMSFRSLCLIGLCYSNIHFDNSLLKKINMKYGGVKAVLDEINFHDLGRITSFSTDDFFDPTRFLGEKLEVIKKHLVRLEYGQAEDSLKRYSQFGDVFFSRGKPKIFSPRDEKYLHPYYELHLFYFLVLSRLGKYDESKVEAEKALKAADFFYSLQVSVLLEAVLNLGVSEDKVDSIFLTFSNESLLSFNSFFFRYYGEKLYGDEFEEFSEKYRSLVIEWSLFYSDVKNGLLKPVPQDLSEWSLRVLDVKKITLKRNETFPCYYYPLSVLEQVEFDISEVKDKFLK